jgi:acyl dehydratase
MDYLYFEDFAVGDHTETAAITVTQADIIDFAQKFDPQLMHTDPEAAKSITGGLIASGWHTASLTMRLMLMAQGKPTASGTLGLGVEKLKWMQPVRPGDALHARVEVVAARASKSMPDKGIVTSHVVTLNQRQELVLELTTSGVLPMRGAG